MHYQAHYLKIVEIFHIFLLFLHIFDHNFESFEKPAQLLTSKMDQTFQ